TLRKEMLQLSRACGQPHPALVSLDRFDILDENLSSRSADIVFDYELGWGLPSAADSQALRELMQSEALPTS
ncbi:MAG: FMN-binding glutamate synthase family protein, partial [Planctomycetaceae bacterium]|nr:FMN-binding glutamate synthase family protein [Planctomycetaceae bacterium]